MDVVAVPGPTPFPMDSWIGYCLLQEMLKVDMDEVDSNLAPSISCRKEEGRREEIGVTEGIGALMHLLQVISVLGGLKGRSWVTSPLGRWASFLSMGQGESWTAMEPGRGNHTWF